MSNIKNLEWKEMKVFIGGNEITDLRSFTINVTKQEHKAILAAAPPAERIPLYYGYKTVRFLKRMAKFHERRHNLKHKNRLIKI